MRLKFTTPVLVIALALAACGDKAADDTTTVGKAGDGKAAPVDAAAPAISGGSWIGNAPYMERGIIAVAFFKPG